MVIKLACMVLAVIALSTSGCGSAPDLPDLAPVSGTVTRGGKPLANVLVEFEPKNTADVRAGTSSGLTNDQGEYELQFSGKSGAKGAIIGDHIVRLTNANAAEVPIEELLPDEFGSKSQLTKTVKEGENTIPIELK